MYGEGKACSLRYCFNSKLETIAALSDRFVWMVVVKQKKCIECGALFSPMKTTQRVCGWECALINAKKKPNEHKQKVNRSIHREKKIKLKTREDWLKDVQAAFNKYIRTRDRGKPCICCGENNNNEYGWDCGHFKSIGSHPELRFELTNAHRQLSRCNRGAAKYRTNERTTSARYEENLIKRIGQEKVDWLNSKHEPKKYTIDELKGMLVDLRVMTKCLEEKS